MKGNVFSGRRLPIGAWAVLPPRPPEGGLLARMRALLVPIARELKNPLVGAVEVIPVRDIDAVFAS